MASNPLKRHKSFDPECCQSCNKACSYDNLTQYRFLCDEKHSVCSFCYAESVTKIRQSKLLGLVCPCCQQECTSFLHGYTGEGASTRSGTQVGAKEPKTYKLDPLDSQEHPVQHHRSLGDQMHNFVTLSVSYGKEGAEMEHKSACISTTSSPDDLGEEAIGVMELIGLFLHGFLIAMVAVAAVSVLPDVPTIEELSSLAFECYSPLMRFVFCLCYGQTMSQVDDAQKDSADKSWLKLRVKIFTIMDLIRSVRTEGTGLIQKTVGLVLRANNAAQNVYNKLNDLGLCLSYRTELRNKMKNFISAIREGLTEEMKFTRWDLLLVIFDNIGFKRGGSATRVGYLQMTLLIMVILSRKDLVRLKIYPDPDAPYRTPVLSRTRKKWLEICSEETSSYEFVVKHGVDYDTVEGKRVMTTPEDHLNFLAESSFRELKLMVDVLKDYGLSGYTHAEEILKTSSIRWIESIPTTFGQSVVDSSQQQSFHVVDTTGPSLQHVMDYNDIFEANNAFMDVAMKRDLSLNQTLLDIRDYVLDFSDFKLEPAEIENIFNEWKVNPIKDDVGLLFGCDGKPAIQLAGMWRESELEGADFGVTTTFGGFHAMITAILSGGALFRKSTEEDVYIWRDTDGKRDWVFKPSDPDQALKEIRETKRALKGHLYLGYLETLHKDEPDESEFERYLTDLVDHMVARCIKYPSVGLFLVNLRHAESILLLGESEREASFRKYQAALKLLDSGYATSHHKGYVLLLTDYFVWLFCSSDADLVLQKEFVLFRKSKNGRNMFSDHYMEKGVGEVRTFEGKKDTSTGDTKANQVSYTTAELSKLLQARFDSKRRKTLRPDDEDGRTKLIFDKIFLEAFLYFRDLNLFGPGAPRHVPSKPFKVRLGMDQSTWKPMSPNELKTPSGNDFVVPELLDFDSIGEDRLQRYFEIYYGKEGYLKIKRTENEEKDNGVSLHQLQALADSVKEADNRLVERAISLDSEFLKKRYGSTPVYSVDELKKEAKELNEEIKAKGLGDAIRPQVTEGKTNPNKSQRIAAVIEARKRLINHDGQWVANRKNKVKDSLPARQDLSATVRRVFQKDLYTFKNTAAYRRYQGESGKIRMKVYPTDDAVEMGSAVDEEEDTLDDMLAYLENLSL